jgi:hypothetical protein
MAPRVGPSTALSALHGGDRYERHRPEDTVPYRVVRSYWDSFRERLEAIGSLPRFVVREVEEYLRCGILEYGFLRVECEACGFARLVAFSCKLARVCAMVPPPRFHMVRFHGVLAPNAALRKEVVASARPSAPPQVAPRAPLQLPLFGELFNVGDDPEANGRRKPWAWLLRHVFSVDVTVCPKCAGTMRWRNVALTPDAIREGLARAGLSARGPPMRKRVPLGQFSLPFPKAYRREQP